MKVIELIPHEGIPFISFGMTREKVYRLMKEKYFAGEPYLNSASTALYFENSLQFSFENETLSFIEIFSPPPIGAKIFNLNTWELTADQLMSELLKVDSIDETVSEDGTCPVFKNNIITLGDLQEEYDQFENCIERRWNSVGIGDSRYYKAISELLN